MSDFMVHLQPSFSHSHHVDHLSSLKFNSIIFHEFMYRLKQPSILSQFVTPRLVYFNLLCMHMSITSMSSRPKEGNSLCVFAWLSPFPGLCPPCPPFEGAWQLKQRWCPRHHRPLHHRLSGNACEHCVWPEPQLMTISKMITGDIINVVLSPSSSVWRYHRRHHQCGIITVIIHVALSPSSSMWCYHHRHQQCGVIAITTVIISVVLSPSSSVWCYHRHQCGVITVIISVALSLSSSVWCYHRHHQGGVTTVVIISVVLSPSSPMWCYHCHHQCGVITVIIIISVVLSPSSSMWCYHHRHHQCGVIAITTVIISVVLSPSSSVWCYHRHHQCGVITMNLNHLHPTKLSVSAACCLSPSLARKKEYQFTMFQLVNLSPIQYFACIHVQQF